MTKNWELCSQKGATATHDLDCDDEYYPDFLEYVERFAGKGDVLAFGYDVVADTNPEPIKPFKKRRSESPEKGSAGTNATTSDPPVIGFAGTTPAPSDDPVIGCAETTPPGPPFARGGKVLAAKSSGGSDAGRGSTIGLVGPMSNYAAPPQLVEGVPYRDVEDMYYFARRWRDEHRGQWFTVPKLSGFCLLMKRDVYTKIGGLDERFGMGMFDDDDLAERARRAGFELAVAHSQPLAG